MPKTLTAKDLGLKSDSFVSGFSDSLDSRRVIANIEGAQKCGKDYFSLTAPDPIVVFNFDQGLEGVVEQFLRKGKQILVAGDPKLKGQGKYPSYRFARPVPADGENRKSSGYLERVKKLAYPIWERFISDLDDFYHSEARTGIIDTGGAAFGLAKFAYLGMDKGKPAADQDPYGQKSGDMKTLFQGLVTDGYSYDKNMLWLHRIKEIWEGSSPTGKFEAEGYKQIAYETQVTVRLSKKMVPREGNKFTATIRDCRLDTRMEGEEFSNKLCNFTTVMAAITGTDEDEWV